MTDVSVAAKLQIKPNQSVAVLHRPPGVEIELPTGAKTSVEPESADAVMLFVTSRKQLDERSRPFIEAATRDALAWIAYPKAGQLDTDLNRDSLSELLEQRRIRPVRQISIDDTWSAVRFRPG